MADIANQRGTIHIDKYLTNKSIAYASQIPNMIHHKLFPNVMTNKQSDKYVVFDNGAGRRIENDIVSPRTVPNKVISWKFSNDAFYCDPHALSDDYTPDEEANADLPINHAKDTMEGVVENVLLIKEYNLATLAFTAGNFTNTAAATTKWDADDGLDPRIQVNSAINIVRLACGVRPNTMVINSPTFDALQINPYVSTYLSDAADKDVNLKKLAAFFNINRILVGSATYNSAKEGQTAVQADLWTDNALLCYVSPRPQMKSPSFGYTYEWNKYSAKQLGISNDMRTATRPLIKKFKQQRPELTFIDAYNYYSQKITFNTAGYLITDVLT